MTRWTWMAWALLAAASGCDGGEGTTGLGYTAHISIEIDGAYRGDYCVLGDHPHTGATSATLARGSLEALDLRWNAEDGVLALRVGHDLDANMAVVLIDAAFDAAFGTSGALRSLVADYEGHRVVVYVESLGQAYGCDGAMHRPSDYDGGPLPQGDAGVEPPLDGGTAPLPVPHLLDLHGTARDDVWAVGFDGALLHFDGAGWMRWPQAVEDETLDLIAIWAAPNGDLWIVARSGFAETEERTLLRGRPGAFEHVALDLSPGELVARPYGTSESDVWLTSYVEEEGGRVGTVRHFDGVAWSIPASGIGGHLSCAWASGPSDVFIAGNDGGGLGGYVAHFSDGAFDWNEYPESWIGGIWGSASDDVWTVGGVLRHYDGSTWTQAEKPPVHHMFLAVWGSASDDVWAVGNQGTTATGVSGVILHWDGDSWREADVTPANELVAIWGSAANDVWAVGSGAIYHFDGDTWIATPASAISVRR